MVINRKLEIQIEFKGISFEMEDQRNWGDESYKIYSGSLYDPFPYKIDKGTKFFQKIEIITSKKKTRTCEPLALSL